MKNKPGFAKFVCKVEGKPFVQVTPKYEPFVVNEGFTLNDLGNLLGLVEDYNSGDTIDNYDREFFDYILWSSTPFENLFSNAYNTGYFHPECREYLESFLTAYARGDEFFNEYGEVVGWN